MVVKILFLAFLIVASLITEPVWCAVDAPCQGGQDDCEPIEKCDSATTKCVARSDCDVHADCNDHGTCDGTDHSCKCASGFIGNDCSKADPCNVSPCTTNGECSFNVKLATPGAICKCKNGYGGPHCTNAPECTDTNPCPDPSKPDCKKEDGKQSVCVASGSGAVTGCTVNDDCKNGGTCGTDHNCQCKPGFKGDTCETENGGNIVAATPALLMTLLLAVFFM